MSITLLSNKKVKCRKKHTCWGCGKEIEKGSYATLQKSVQHNNIYNTYTCEFCESVLFEMDDLEHQEIREWDLPNTDIYQEMYREEFGRDPF